MSRLSLALAALALAAAPVARAADVILPHMGRLLTTSPSGGDAPVNGVKKLKFALHRKNIDADGEDNLVWEQEYPGVEVQNGFYKVDLGETGAGRAPLDLDDLVSAPSLWLEITVFEEGETAGKKLTPRMRLQQSFAALKAGDAANLGGRPAGDYLTKSEFESFKTELTGGGSGGLSIPWSKVTLVPDGFADGTDDGLRSVVVGGLVLDGQGTSEAPLRVKEGAVDTVHLKDGAVTAAKLAPNAVTPELFGAGSIPANKLVTCPEGQILKMQSGSWQCGIDTGSGGSLSFNVLAPIEQVPGENGSP